MHAVFLAGNGVVARDFWAGNCMSKGAGSEKVEDNEEAKMFFKIITGKTLWQVLHHLLVLRRKLIFVLGRLGKKS